MKINEIDIDIKILTKFCDISNLDNYFYDDVKNEFIEKFKVEDRINDIIVEKELSDKTACINVSLNQFDREIILTNTDNFISPTLKNSNSFSYYGSRATGHYAGVQLSVKQTYSHFRGISFKCAIITEQNNLNSCCQPIIETIISVSKFNKFSNLEFTILSIENIDFSTQSKLVIATIKCLKEIFQNEIKL